jgi:hypothetical protein
LLTKKAANLNQEFPKGWSKGRLMQGAHAIRCLPAAFALPGCFVVHGNHNNLLAGAG